MRRVGELQPGDRIRVSGVVYEVFAVVPGGAGTNRISLMLVRLDADYKLLSYRVMTVPVQTSVEVLD